MFTYLVASQYIGTNRVPMAGFMSETDAIAWAEAHSSTASDIVVVLFATGDVIHRVRRRR